MPMEKLEWPANPKIYEINTWPWLKSLTEKYNIPITLNNIPSEVFNQEIIYFDAIWLMGVWERSPASKIIALGDTGLQNEYHKALHEFRDEDVVGSPYSIYYYQVDKHIGGIEGLIEVRQQLSERGIRLLLDYVPNHVSIDSLWTLESNLFIEGTLDDLMNNPEDYFSLSGKVYAHGRDPNYRGWTDTIQINAFSKESRQKTINTLLKIAELCDGVRCDMAMLMTNAVFKNTWGEKAGSIPSKEFWVEVIQAVKKKFPHFLFIAEVYWDMEWELQQQGFDFCYDKRLYERLSHGDSQSIKAHLIADLDYQRKLVRFIENHDELRASTSLEEKRNYASAIVFMTLPGARLIHEGQMRGYKIKLPVQLGRRQIENENQDLLKFYSHLLQIVPGRDLENGDWNLCEVNSVELEDRSFTNIISYLWWSENTNRLIVVNFGSGLVKAHIAINQLNYGSSDWFFTDLLTGKKFTYNGMDLDKFGLYVELTAWEGHIFDIKKII